MLFQLHPMDVDPAFEAFAANYPCESADSLDASAQILREKSDELISAGYRVTFTDALAPSAEYCCPEQFIINERSSGGFGLTRWFEIAIYCPRLFVRFFENEDFVNLSEGLVPERLGSFSEVSRSISNAVQHLRGSGLDCDFRARVAWDELGVFDVLEPIAQPIIPNHKYTERARWASFYQYLKEFPEDSTENICGRIWEAVRDLDFLLGGCEPRGKAKINFAIANKFVELGQLTERLAWKVSIEAQAAHGRKFDTKRNARTSKAVDANQLDRIKRHRLVFHQITLLDRVYFLTKSTGRVNAARLARAVVASAPFQGVKSGMTAGSVENLIRQNMEKLKFKGETT